MKVGDLKIIRSGNRPISDQYQEDTTNDGNFIPTATAINFSPLLICKRRWWWMCKCKS